jgi:transposase
VRYYGRHWCGTMATQIIEVREASPPRRQFSDDDKARVVSEAMMPGSSVTAVARRHRICASLIYRWRRELLGGERVERPAPSFVPVEVATAPASRSAGSSPGIVEVVAPSGHVVRLTPPIDARVLKAVLAGIG